MAGAAARRSKTSRSRTGSGCTTCWSAPRCTWLAPSPSRWRRLQQGRFAIISAKEAQAPTSKNAAYATAKAASEAVVLALANGFKGTAATANVVVVPAILTPAMREKNPDKDWGAFVPAEADRRRPGVPLLPRWRQDERTTHSSLLRRAFVSHRGFASDNYAGVHPDVLAKIAEVNVGHVVSYGDDPYTAAGRRAFPLAAR